MAATVNNGGLASIKVDYGSGLALAGYTRNGADISEDVNMTDVPGDENGGDEGPPIEIQIMGETARVRLEMTKWDATVIAAIKARIRGGTAGTPPTAGTMIFSGSKDFRLLVHSVNLPFNFPRAVPRSAIEMNNGTKYATMVIEFTCYKDANGVLYNQTTT